MDAWQGLLYTICRIRAFRKPLPAVRQLPPLPPGALVGSAGTVGIPPPANIYATFPRPAPRGLTVSELPGLQLLALA